MNEWEHDEWTPITIKTIQAQHKPQPGIQGLSLTRMGVVSKPLLTIFFLNEKKRMDLMIPHLVQWSPQKINCQITKLKRLLYFFLIINDMFLVIDLGEILVLLVLASSDSEATLGCFWRVRRAWSTPRRHCACSFSSHCRLLRFSTKEMKATATENTQGGMDWSTSSASQADRQLHHVLPPWVCYVEFQG